MTETKKHVYIIGSKGYLSNYGGWETFVRNLIQHWENNRFVFHIPEIVYDRSEESHFTTNGVLIDRVYSPRVGAASMIIFCVRSFYKALREIKEQKHEGAVIYILGLRIGPFVLLKKSQIRKSKVRVLINPDGFEWERAKWSWPVKKYFLFSEWTMYRGSTLIVCDSKVVKHYVDEKFKKYKIPSVYIAYGAPVPLPITITDQFRDFLEENRLSVYGYNLIVGRFVPENNYELIIKEYMKSKTQKPLIIISNVEKNAFYSGLLESTRFDKDERIRFIGTVYNQALLIEIRQNATAYIHGHSAGGTNPSLLEAMGSTDLNLLLNVGFNREVGQDAALYFGNGEIALSELLSQIELMSDPVRQRFSLKAKQRIIDDYSWEKICSEYESVFDQNIEQIV